MSKTQYKNNVPGHPGVNVKAWINDDGKGGVEYIGGRDAILAMGLVTAETLKVRRKGEPFGKYDVDGSRISIQRYSCKTEPRERLIIRHRDKTAEQIRRMPGGREALKRAYETNERRECEWREREEARRLAELESDESMEAGRRLARPGSFHFDHVVVEDEDSGGSCSEWVALGMR